MNRAAPLVVLFSMLLAACADDPSDVPVTSVPTTTIAASTTIPATTTSPATTVAPAATAATPTTIPVGTDRATTDAIVPPSDIVTATPFQYRLDVAAGVFQIRLRNGSSDPLTIVGIQMVWDGLTTPVAERHDTLPPRLSLDFPVQLAPATCTGDGLLDDMPPVAGAVARLALDDGTEMDVPVFDVDGVAQRLYLDDCERQMIESQVTVEWTDLRDEPLDGRIVTGGGIRVIRKNATGDVTVLSISNTILYTVETIDSGPDDPVVTLQAGQDEVTVPIRITENRCDAHARSESSQSFRFFSQVDLGGGDVHQYTIFPTKVDQVAMRARLEAGCAYLEQTGFLGQDDGA